ncbi:MAG: hypothetical protein WCI75_08110 [candidate division NC10 bacterium]
MPSGLFATLFPAVPRRLPCARGLNIAFRTAHLVTSGILLGGHVFEIAPHRLLPLLYLTIASGAGLIALELYRSCQWVYQGMGLLVEIKLALLIAAGIWWDARVPLVILVVILGSVGAHLPARYRHYSLLHGRVLGEHSSPHP